MGIALNPFKIQYSMLTVPRSDGRLKYTLESLDESGFFGYVENLPLRLVAGSPDKTHLERFRPYPEYFFVDQMSDGEASQWNPEISPAWKATIGYSRCLRKDAVSKDASGILIMEDDLKFAKGWLERLDVILKDIVARFQNKWVLSLYSPASPEPLVAFRSGMFWTRRPYESFYGALALLYPIGIPDACLEYIATNPMYLPYDLAFAVAMRELNIPILSSAPCLVQHTGTVSVGSGAAFHTSHSFLENV